MGQIRTNTTGAVRPLIESTRRLTEASRPALRLFPTRRSGEEGVVRDTVRTPGPGLPGEERGQSRTNRIWELYTRPPVVLTAESFLSPLYEYFSS